MLIWECSKIGPDVYLRRGTFSIVDDPRNFAKTAKHMLKWRYRQVWSNAHMRKARFRAPPRVSRAAKSTPSQSVRETTRRTRAQVETEQLERAMSAAEEAACFALADCGARGRGVLALRVFARDEWVMEYAGELLDWRTAKQREKVYAQEPDKYGSYTYFFQDKGGRKWCVDATTDDGRMGRMLNHSRRTANLGAVVKEVAGSLHVVFRALRDIAAGEELLFDYGDRAPEALAAFPWLND